MNRQTIQVQGKGSVSQFDREIIPPHPVRDDAEYVQRLQMIRLRRQGSAGKPFGICEPPRPMALERKFKGLGDRHIIC